MTRGELKEKVRDWAKGGSSTRLPLDRIFDLAQAMVIRDLHPVELDVYVELTAVPAQVRGQVWSYYLPADCIKLFLAANNGHKLPSKRPDDLLSEYGAVVATATYKPAFHATMGRELWVGPGPGGSVTIGYHSADKRTPLDSESNVGMALGHDVYFWGMMRYAYMWYEDLQGAEGAGQAYNAALLSFNNNADALRMAAGGRAMNG